jgi:hypothetical protein
MQMMDWHNRALPRRAACTVSTSVFFVETAYDQTGSMVLK